MAAKFAAAIAAAIAGAMDPANTDTGLSLKQPDHAARAKERLASVVALLEAEIPDPLQRLAIISAIIDYGTERALGAIDSMGEHWQRSIDGRASR